MGGRLLDRDDIVDWGLKVTDGCMSTYNTATGLGVGSWGFRGEDGGGEVPAEHQDFFDQNGWYPGAKDWNVRPEVFEVCLIHTPVNVSTQVPTTERFLRLACHWRQQVLRFQRARNPCDREILQEQQWLCRPQGRNEWQCRSRQSH